ncbi:MAG TPA: hypothetical protein VMS81_04780 [Methanomicrobiales archaeon]|nr:hypothetical protein [Methanomicrobiales archaeon]
MNDKIRQMILGLGTFGTGTALLYLDVNPLLLILTDTVVGVGMLFAAGSLSVKDLKIRKGMPGEPGEGAAAASGPVAALEGETPSHGLAASLGRMGGSLKPSFLSPKPKEEQKAEEEKIDLMLDSALVGQSRRIISLAEGQGGAGGAITATAGTAAAEPDPLQELTGADIPTQLLEEVSPEEEDIPVPGGGAAAFPKPGEEPAEPRADVLNLSDGGIGADDLLTALRAEATKEKKKDDSSLLRNLKGVKVTGRQLLDELDGVLKQMKGR